MYSRPSISLDFNPDLFPVSLIANSISYLFLYCLEESLQLRYSWWYFFFFLSWDQMASRFQPVSPKISRSSSLHEFDETSSATKSDRSSPKHLLHHHRRIPATPLPLEPPAFPFHHEANLFIFHLSRRSAESDSGGRAISSTSWCRCASWSSSGFVCGNLAAFYNMNQAHQILLACLLPIDSGLS